MLLSEQPSPPPPGRFYDYAADPGSGLSGGEASDTSGETDRGFFSEATEATLALGGLTDALTPQTEAPTALPKSPDFYVQLSRSALAFARPPGEPTPGETPQPNRMTHQAGRTMRQRRVERRTVATANELAATNQELAAIDKAVDTIRNIRVKDEKMAAKTGKAIGEVVEPRPWRVEASRSWKAQERRVLKSRYKTGAINRQQYESDRDALKKQVYRTIEGYEAPFRRDKPTLSQRLSHGEEARTGSHERKLHRRAARLERRIVRVAGRGKPTNTRR